MLNVFKTHDIRTVGEKLTPEIQDRLLDSIVLFCKKDLKVKTVVLGRDARLMAPVLLSLAIKKFSQASIEVVYNSEPISTCQFYYTCMQNQVCAGLMFTASHNPGKYIGVKIVRQNLVPVSMGSGLEKIKEYFDSEETDFSCLKNCTEKETKCISYENSYIDYCMKLAGVKENSLKGINLFFEFLCGSAGAEISHAFEKAGASITVRNFSPNGNFPAGDPNPIIESSIAPARNAMKEGKFDLGFCFDGDGDRMDIMWQNGEQIAPGFNMSVLMPELIKIFNAKRKDFFVDMKAIPNGIVKICKAGANVHIIRNGHAFIKRKLSENISNGYLGCVEESAHYYLNFPYDCDNFSNGFVASEFTLFFALLTARCYKENPEQYARVYRDMTKISRVREWSLHCENNPEVMPEILDKVKTKMISMGAKVIDRMEDGEDLEAVLMRINLPAAINEETNLSGNWTQVAQRISGSEDGLCRFEVTSSNETNCIKTNEAIRAITDSYAQRKLITY